MAKSKKMSNNEKVTIGISSLALLLTLIQLVFSTPYFSDRIYHADVIGRIEKSGYKEGKLNSIYTIKNEGNKSSETLAISFTCFKDDKITTAPNLNIIVEEKENGPALKDIIIKTESFLPGDYIFVMISTDSLKHSKDSMSNIVPFLGQIKSKDGFGKIIRNKSSISELN